MYIGVNRVLQCVLNVRALNFPGGNILGIEGKRPLHSHPVFLLAVPNLANISTAFQTTRKVDSFGVVFHKAPSWDHCYRLYMCMSVCYPSWFLFFVNFGPTGTQISLWIFFFTPFRLRWWICVTFAEICKWPRRNNNVNDSVLYWIYDARSQTTTTFVVPWSSILIVVCPCSITMAPPI